MPLQDQLRRTAVEALFVQQHWGVVEKTAASVDEAVAILNRVATIPWQQHAGY